MNRKLTRLVRRGLLCPWPAKTTTTQQPAPPRPKQQEVYVEEHTEPLTALLSHAQEKRHALFECRAEEEQAPDDLPRVEDGWQETRPVDAELIVDGVRVIRLADGECRKFFHVTVTRDAVKRRRNRAKKMLKRIEREDRVAAKKQLRMFMALLGK